MKAKGHTIKEAHAMWMESNERASLLAGKKGVQVWTFYETMEGV